MDNFEHLRPLILGHVPEELDVGQGELGDGAHAGQGVGGAGGHLPGCEDGHVPTLGGLGVGLHHGPAAAACLLILDREDGPHLPPVHGLGMLGGQAPGGGGQARDLLVAARVLGLELLVMRQSGH